MTKFKGTKGKWTVEQPEHINSTYVWFEDFKGHIQLWHHHGDSATKEEAIANALLISKAPEMLEVLMSFVNDFDNGLIDDFQIPRDRFEQLIKEAIEL